MTATLLGNISAAGILGLVAVMFFTGMIVSRRVYKDMERQRDFWEAEWRIIRDKEAERTDTKIEANTEALRLFQQSVESLSKRRAS
jgi:hypothetical protein